MINPGAKILKAWFELLDGNVPGFGVFRTDAPAGYAGNYILLRLESSTDASNNARNVTRPVIVTEVVTRHDAMIDETVAINGDSVIGQLLIPSPGTHSLPAQDGIQITSVKRRDGTMLPEDNGAIPRLNRLITRNIHRVMELVDAS